MEPEIEGNIDVSFLVQDKARGTELCSHARIPYACVFVCAFVHELWEYNFSFKWMNSVIIHTIRDYCYREINVEQAEY